MKNSKMKKSEKRNKKNMKEEQEEHSIERENSSDDDGVEYIQKQTDGFVEQKSIGTLLGSILAQTRLGTDLLSSGISLPSYLYEPLTVLERQAEMLEYSYLLDKAAECKDPIDRMAYVAAFAVSGVSSTQRYHNNFNPILGETFEFVDEKNGYKFFCEQVSHHPPISATHAEKDNGSWVFYQNSNPTTSFLGNAISIDTQGKTHIYFANRKEHYFYTCPKSRLHNIIFGKMWIEHHGELKVSNLKTGDNCTVNFKKCGFFGSGVDYTLSGNIQDSDGNICVELEGRWDEYLQGTWLVETKQSEIDKTEELWRIYENNYRNDKFHFSRYAHSLIYMDDELRELLPPTDSRFRLDIISLQEDTDQATRQKKIDGGKTKTG